MQDARVLVRTLILLCLTATLAHAQPNLLLIGWDGADSDAIDHMLSLDKLPTLSTLAFQGGYWPLTVERFPGSTTSTKPGWAEIHTGVDPTWYGIYTNTMSAAIPDGDTLFERLQADDPDIALGWLTGKAGNTDLYCDCPHCTQAPFRNLCDNIPVANRYPEDRKTQNHASNTVLADRAITFLQAHATERFALSVILAFPDHAGHRCPDIEWGSSGWNHGYMRSLIAVPGDGGSTHCADRATGQRVTWTEGTDHATGRILTVLDDLGLRSSTLVVLTSDHGFPQLPFPANGSRGHSHHPRSWAASSQDLNLHNATLREVFPAMWQHLTD